MAVAEPKRRVIVAGNTAMSFVAAELAQGERVTLARGFHATVNGFEVDGTPPLAAWELPGKRLRVLERGAQFAIGDYANLLEQRFGEAAAQVLDPELGWSLRTLSVYRWLAERIPLVNRRMDRLGIKHHLLVARLTHAKQREWLLRAAADDDETPWTAARLKKALEAGEDLPIEAWYVLVGPLTSGQVQSDLMDRLEAEGLGVKAVDKRRRKAADPAPAPALLAGLP